MIQCKRPPVASWSIGCASSAIRSEMTTTTIPARQIRAQYDASTLRVYQAYSDAIADSALKHQTFVAPSFKMERMTWIKPSFLWMMYRAGWGYKDAGQSRILAIDITHEGFAWALAHGCTSHPEPGMDAQEWEALKSRSPVRVQWDPERDLHHRPLEHRAIQIGLSGEAVRLYIGEWTQRVTDVTPLAHRICGLVREDRLDEAKAALPSESPYTPT
ncbi:hypothetical protein QE447_003182 [Stenotrophomonas sp. SORGH_AS282]|nr:hypothetical protein [Stenotrophomonas sp. SORGH_AS_0282]MDQ1190679.1 hypothetical protein [Stenotrophomonas sp. SORGH_AS_0282]